MKRSDLYRRVSGHFPDLAAQDVEKCIDLLLARIGEHLQSGQRAEFRGFGNFASRQRAPRTARNPKTGDKVRMEAKRVLHFKPSRELTKRINLQAAPIKRSGRRW